jgi:putative sterol carrier protein
MTLADLTAKMKEGASKKSAFGNTVKFATDQGVVYIDGNQNPPDVTNDDKAADCTLRMDFSDFSDMITGKLKIEGDMGVAMKLQSILR